MSLPSPSPWSSLSLGMFQVLTWWGKGIGGKGLSREELIPRVLLNSRPVPSPFHPPVPSSPRSCPLLGWGRGLVGTGGQPGGS